MGTAFVVSSSSSFDATSYTSPKSKQRHAVFDSVVWSGETSSEMLLEMSDGERLEPAHLIHSRTARSSAPDEGASRLIEGRSDRCFLSRTMSSSQIRSPPHQRPFTSEASSVLRRATYLIKRFPLVEYRGKFGWVNVRAGEDLYLVCLRPRVGDSLLI